MGVVPGAKSILNSISLSGGNDTNSSGNMSGYSFIVDISSSLPFSPGVLTKNARYLRTPLLNNFLTLISEIRADEARILFMSNLELSHQVSKTRPPLFDNLPEHDNELANPFL